MSLKPFIPSLPEIGREAVIVLAGALLATIVVRALPEKYRKLFTFPTSTN